MRRLSPYVGCLLVGLLSGGIIGHRIKAREVESLSSIPSLDYFTADESFSEIENAKAVLAGLAGRFLTVIQTERCLQLRNSVPGSGTMASSSLPYPDQLINQLELGFEQFRGTEGELILAHNLLSALRSNALYERWLRTYLTLLYAHPTDELVVAHAEEAIAIGARLGREKEVLDGLRHLDEMPPAFQNKTEGHTTLIQLQENPSVAANLKIAPGR